jgi:hypothetical protein
VAPVVGKLADADGLRETQRSGARPLEMASPR